MTTDSFSSPDNLIEDSSSSSSFLTGKSSSSCDDWIRVDRTIAHIGKLKRDSKRRIQWVLQHRPTETLVRIVLVWSLKSGKFSIAVNDVEEVWEQRNNSSSSTNSLLDHSFTPRAIVFKEQPQKHEDVSHYYDHDDDGDDTTTNDTTNKDMSSSSSLLLSTKIRIVAAKMVPSRTPFIQYDLMIDGVKFHHMPGNCPLPDEGLPSLADVVVVVASAAGASSSSR